MQNKKLEWNKTEVLVYILRNYKNRTEFCLKLGINSGSFTNWLSKPVFYPRIEQAIYKDMIENNYEEIDRVIKETRRR